MDLVDTQDIVVIQAKADIVVRLVRQVIKVSPEQVEFQDILVIQVLVAFQVIVDIQE